MYTQGHWHGLMCLAQLFHLLLLEAFCDEGIFQVANHYSLKARGSPKDGVCVCVCVSVRFTQPYGYGYGLTK